MKITDPNSPFNILLDSYKATRKKHLDALSRHESMANEYTELIWRLESAIEDAKKIDAGAPGND